MSFHFQGSGIAAVVVSSSELVYYLESISHETRFVPISGGPNVACHWVPAIMHCLFCLGMNWFLSLTVAAYNDEMTQTETHVRSKYRLPCLPATTNVSLFFYMVDVEYCSMLAIATTCVPSCQCGRHLDMTTGRFAAPRKPQEKSVPRGSTLITSSPSTLGFLPT